MSNVSSPQNQESSSITQGLLQGTGTLATVGRKLLDSRFQVPVRVGASERDVYEAPLRVHSGLDGVSKALAGVDTTTQTSARATKALEGVKLAGKGLVALGAVLDIRDVAKSMAADRARGDGRRVETRKALGRVAGGWGGALAGAKLGAQYGAALPYGGPLVGMIVGSIVGGVGGHIGGEKLAS